MSSSFASTLSSLISTPTSSNAGITHGRPRHSKASSASSSLFTKANRGIQKRTLADLQQHNSSSTAELRGSKRKLEEKARLYAALKRGEYVPSAKDRSKGVNLEELALVDFDRKWAESDTQRNGSVSSSEGEDRYSDSGSDNENEHEVVEYEDEFGRMRTGSKKDAERQKRKRDAAAYAAEQIQEASARPAMPETVIRGNTIQSAAFNPDARMEALAATRDKSPTPPPEEHYDASKEVRGKGVGFYAFSKDEGERKREMEELEAMRQETEKGRQEREERKAKRVREVEERKRVIRRKREEKEADRFLRELG
ncbi:MAG: hypothetical protein LQ351_003102 [Letrouitia transgressa]|nr:MAG: hypothetical protein LQ351_003102 [Letrouitia transgressa]